MVRCFSRVENGEREIEPVPLCSLEALNFKETADIRATYVCGEARGLGGYICYIRMDFSVSGCILFWEGTTTVSASLVRSALGLSAFNDRVSFSPFMWLDRKWLWSSSSYIFFSLFSALFGGVVWNFWGVIARSARFSSDRPGHLPHHSLSGLIFFLYLFEIEPVLHVIWTESGTADVQKRAHVERRTDCDVNGEDGLVKRGTGGIFLYELCITGVGSDRAPFFFTRQLSLNERLPYAFVLRS